MVPFILSVAAVSHSETAQTSTEVVVMDINVKAATRANAGPIYVRTCASSSHKAAHRKSQTYVHDYSRVLTGCAACWTYMLQLACRAGIQHRLKCAIQLDRVCLKVVSCLIPPLSAHENKGDMWWKESAQKDILVQLQ